MTRATKTREREVILVGTAFATKDEYGKFGHQRHQNFFLQELTLNVPQTTTNRARAHF